MSEAIKRAITMLGVAADHCEKYAPCELTYYDEIDCDGQCVADDCRTAARELESMLSKSKGQTP